MTPQVRLRRIDNMTLAVGDAGRFFRTSMEFVDRVLDGSQSLDDQHFLRAEGHLVDATDQLGQASRLYGLSERLAHCGDLDYLILVPTLRCNLGCSYCQVSRVSLDRPGFDWSEATFDAVLALIDRLPGDRLKIEFQGGEPTLRLDLVNAVIDRAERFEQRQFVICSNLQVLSDELMHLLSRPDVYLSTSLDGDAATHMRHRTGTSDITGTFLSNLRQVVDMFGPEKVSALPTIDPKAPPEPDALIDSYQAFGLDSIFLRPINYQGFARKRHAASREQASGWHAYHERFVRRVIERNWLDRTKVLEETYFSICLRRIFQPGADRHVDLRNPNPLGVDYVVIDHDGLVYPTDEARMLSRSRVIDLSIGGVGSGWEGERRDALNAHCSNIGDPDCDRCAYQPYCGRDLVDDIARYGRIDVPRTETEFCRRHMAVFDLAFRLIYEDDPAVQYSLKRWLRLDGDSALLGPVHL